MDQINKAASVLKKGGVIIFPTDTVYGFLADASNKKAVAKIYKIKKRPKAKPLPVFVSSVKMARELAEVDSRALKMFKKYWPGAYTFVLKRKPGMKLYGQDEKTIALRMPKHVALLKLLRKVGKPLVQTSVNISTQEPLNSKEAIYRVFGKNRLVELIVASSKPLKGKSSKIIDLTGNKLTRLR